MGSPVVQVALGMALTFAVVAALTSVATELVARFLGLRARFLLLGLRELLDTDEVATVELNRAQTTYAEFRTPTAEPRSATEAVLGAPILRSQGMPGTVSSRKVTIEKTSAADMRLPKVRVGGAKWLFGNPLRRLPSYVSARTFSAALFDLIVPDASGATDLDRIRAEVAKIHGFPALTEPLETLLKTSGDSVERFRESVEGWYDDHMDRVSGWYKRHIAKWSLVFGVVLVLVLNVDSISIARTLYTNDDIRTAVTAVATEATQCDDKQGEELTACLDTLGKQLEQAREAGLPVGWGVVTQCQPEGTCASFWERYGMLAPGRGWWDWHPLVVLFGWLVTMVALVPGSRFWFDLLGRLGSLRTTGPKPGSST